MLVVLKDRKNVRLLDQNDIQKKNVMHRVVRP